MDAEQLREYGHKMVDFIADYYKTIENFPVLSQVQVFIYLYIYTYKKYIIIFPILFTCFLPCFGWQIVLRGIHLNLNVCQSLIVQKFFFFV